MKNKDINETKENKRKEKKRKNREFTIITYVFFILFFSLIIYFSYFLTFKKDDFINSSYNPRLSALESENIRGSIKSQDGVTLAETKKDPDNGLYIRTYPKGKEYAHVVGYSINGMSGAEKDISFKLQRSHDFILTRLYNDIFEKKNMGDTAVLTIDSRLQDAAYKGIGSYNGAVIAIDPDTGKVLLMVSQPAFDPNTIGAEWDSIVSDESSSVLLNRATQGMYPPGSTFKIFTALSYLNDGNSEGNTFYCTGEYSYEGNTIHCYHNTAHGEEDFKKAFAMSCNSAFAEMGLTLDIDSYQGLMKRALFNETLPTRISDVKKSSFSLKKDASSHLIMQTAIGQGETLVTPIHMAMIASAIANDGYLYKPYTIDKIESPGGALVYPYFKSPYGEVFKKEEADTLKGLMREVVTNGTGSALLSDNYTAYGKTGTAEFSSNKDEAHSWFVGFAEKDDKKIAIAVIMEGAGAGSAHAVPLAKSVFDTYYSE